MKRIVILALAMMLTFSAGALAQTAYVGGSDPQSRVNLRSGPNTDSASLGRFVSGTQVEILGDAGGGWSQVRIGGTVDTLGYMMTSYLHSDLNAVADAKTARSVVSPYGTPVVVLRDRPSNSYNALSMLAVGARVHEIGVSGDFCYVLLEGGMVGCLAAEELE